MEQDLHGDPKGMIEARGLSFRDHNATVYGNMLAASASTA